MVGGGCDGAAEGFGFCWRAFCEGEVQVEEPMWLKTVSSFMRVWQIGQATRPSSGVRCRSGCVVLGSVYSASLPSSAAPS